MVGDVRRVWEWMMRHLVRWLRRRRYAAMAARIHELEIELGMTTAPNRADEAAKERLLMFADAVMLEQHERLITDRHAAATLLGAGYAAASVVDALDCKPTHIDSTIPATVDQYAVWLRAYINTGGHVTHSYDYPFHCYGFVLACSDITVDSRREFGARGRHIIIPAGLHATRSDLSRPRYFDGWAHTQLYLMPDADHPARNVGGIVPVFSDPELRFARNPYLIGCLPQFPSVPELPPHVSDPRLTRKISQ